MPIHPEVKWQMRDRRLWIKEWHENWKMNKDIRNTETYQGYHMSEYHVGNIHKKVQITRRLSDKWGFWNYKKWKGLSGLLPCHSLPTPQMLCMHRPLQRRYPNESQNYRTGLAGLNTSSLSIIKGCQGLSQMVNKGYKGLLRVHSLPILAVNACSVPKILLKLLATPAVSRKTICTIPWPFPADPTSISGTSSPSKSPIPHTERPNLSSGAPMYMYIYIKVVRAWEFGLVVNSPGSGV